MQLLPGMGGRHPILILYVCVCLGGVLRAPRLPGQAAIFTPLALLLLQLTHAVSEKVPCMSSVFLYKLLKINSYPPLFEHGNE